MVIFKRFDYTPNSITDQANNKRRLYHCLKCQYANCVKSRVDNGRQPVDATVAAAACLPRSVCHQPDKVKQMAINLYLEGLGFRGAEEALGISYQASKNGQATWRAP